MSLFLFSILFIIVSQIICEQFVGGTDPVEKQFHFQVSIQVNGTHRCSGSILDDYWILTSALCLYGQFANFMSVSLNEEGNIYNVYAIKPHPLYLRETSANNIGLLKVDAPITMSNLVESIKLSPVSPSPGDAMELSYWGSVSPYLQWSMVNVTNAVVCSTGLTTLVTPGLQFCARAGEEDCGDDSGPLVNDGVQFGILSFGSPSDVRSLICTDVSSYRSWVEQETGSDCYTGIL